ncbi:MAG: SGNH/GDSL hydrolase family protein [Planctomycetota bacterium]
MKRRWFLRLGLVLASTLAVLLLAEFALRLWNPPAVQFFQERVQGNPGERVVKIDETYEVHPKHGIIELDDTLGYRPVLGGKAYATHGAKWNDYALPKPPGVKRLLFLGDSVTDRHRVMDALAARLGPGYEYWNAGVFGYSTEQELIYYRDYLGSIQADHVVLIFHLNDYEVTPVVFPVGDELVAVHSRIGRTNPDPLLMRASYLYRFAWAWASRRTSAARNESIETDVERFLAELRDLVHARGADFTVLVLPWLLPPARWTAPKPRHHELTREILTRLGIRHFEFRTTLERAVAEGVDINESPNDPQHPSDAFAARMADDLLTTGFRP